MVPSTPSSPLIKYDQTPDTHFFLCRQCGTHIARTQEFVFRDIMAKGGILENLVNVETDGPEKYREERNNTTVADVYCKGCNTLLGKKFVKVEAENIILKTGRFFLDLKKALMWEGTEMLYADSHEPVTEIGLRGKYTASRKYL